MKNLTRALRVYLFGLRLGLRIIAAGLLLEGIKILMSPVGYWRFLPNAFTLEEFQQKDRACVLDLGSPKLLSLFLASHDTAEIHATDLDDEKIFSRWKRIADVCGLKNYHVKYEDGRRLSYPDEYFDLVYSISVIEHIPGNGDIQALAEFRRVLKPNGVAVVEVPYRRTYEETLLPYDSKGAPLAEPQFYERHYDAQQLTRRLLTAGLEVKKKMILGEWLPIDPWIATHRLPRLLRILLLPIEPFLAALNYWSRNDDARGRPLGALIVYRKL
jgi:SAM-dependent methyltransferase